MWNMVMRSHGMSAVARSASIKDNCELPVATMIAADPRALTSARRIWARSAAAAAPNAWLLSYVWTVSLS